MKHSQPGVAAALSLSAAAASQQEAEAMPLSPRASVMQRTAMSAACTQEGAIQHDSATAANGNATAPIPKLSMFMMANSSGGALSGPNARASAGQLNQSFAQGLLPQSSAGLPPGINIGQGLGGVGGQGPAMRASVAGMPQGQGAQTRTAPRPFITSLDIMANNSSGGCHVVGWLLLSLNTTALYTIRTP